jgi:deoxyinosine 3'endonuclease (endonuclease V)
MATITAQFPLIYDVPVENLVKYGLAALYLGIQLLTFRLIFGLPFKELMPFTNRLFLALFTLLEFYKCAIHQLLFANAADFLPLFLTSGLCAVAVHLVYLQFLYAVFGQSIRLKIAKQMCLWTEQQIKKDASNSTKIENVKTVAGLDISTHNSELGLSIVSCTVVTYPEMKVCLSGKFCKTVFQIVYSEDHLCLLPYDYCPEFLSLREAKPLANIVERIKKRGIKIDVLLVDGNGTFHSRRCGLACQVGYLSSTPSIGFAKAFGGSALDFYGLNDVTKNGIDQVAFELII